MKKMVITGVNGFIGRHAKEYFEKEFGRDMARDILTFLEESLTKTGSRATL